MDRRIAVVGLGLIGRAWAIAFARAGWQVGLWDPDRTALDRSLGVVDTLLGDLAGFDLLNGATPAEVRGRLEAFDALADALADVSHVQENSPERIEVKRELWSELDRLAPPDAVLASSTSAIVPSRFSEHLAGRARCLVAHPLNPPYVIPAVELVPAPWTGMETMFRAEETMRSIGASVLRMQRELDGFVMNRLQAALMEEAFKLVGNGFCGPEDVDIGLRDGLGLRWSFIGPFETADLNAPGGVRDYVSRYTSVFEAVRETPLPTVDWHGPVLDDIEHVRALRLLREPEEIAARQRWRDRRLMAVMRHKNEASAEIGD